MKSVCIALSLLLVAFAPTSWVHAEQPSDPLMAMGAYVASDDLKASEAFYATLFDQAATIRLDDFIAFDVAGGWLAIVSRDRYAPDSIPGSGAVPYIRVSDLETIQERAARALGEPAPDIIIEPGISLLKLEDPNGQLVEFFTLANP